MEKEKPKPKILRVSDYETKEEFMAAARQIWKEHHPEDSGEIGRRSVADFVFLACEKVIDEIFERKSRERNKFHSDHFSKNPEEALESFGECALCKKTFYPYSVYSIRKVIAEKLKSRGSRMLDGKKQLASRTLDRHINAWLHIQHHDHWLEKGIPSKYRHRFSSGQIKAFEWLRQSRKNRIEKTIERIKALKLSKAEQKEKINEFAISVALGPYAIQRYFPDPLDKKK